MELTEWGIYNADDICISKVKTSLNNRKAAFEKAKFKHGKLVTFLKIKKIRDVEA